MSIKENVEDRVEITSRINRFFQQQFELYGEEIFLLGISPPSLEQIQRATPVLKIGAKDVAPVKQDASKQELLESFNNAFENCQKCRLAETRTKIVLGSGNPLAKVMFVGEAPGGDEDRKGLPFVGAAGQILDRMLMRMGFTRKEIFITNIVKCRPPENRNPLDEEIASCSPLLEKQLNIVKPLFIFCLGRVAANTLLKKDANISSLRKKMFNCHNAKTFVTYHPAALLRNQNLFWDVFEDMKLFRQAYDADIGDKPPMQDMKRES